MLAYLLGNVEFVKTTLSVMYFEILQFHYVILTALYEYVVLPLECTPREVILSFYAEIHLHVSCK